MKTTKFLTTTLTLFLFVGIVSCEEDDPIDKRLIGTWKCIGYGKKGSETIIPLEPKTCEECYVITFKENEEVSVRGALPPKIRMEYSIVKGKIVFICAPNGKPCYHGGTDSVREDIRNFEDMFFDKQKHHYKIENNTLFLHYISFRNKHEYFVFQPKNQ